MYSLCYVRGITEYDTPRFQNINEQQNWFELRKVYVVDDIFPPFYTNKIRIDSNSFSFSNSKANYLYLVFNNKYYYYFINNISYDNYGVYVIDITLDTFQTYYFDIEYNNAIIERKSIKRWNSDGTINRKYIRENISNAIFKQKSYRNISDIQNWKISWYLFAFSDTTEYKYNISTQSDYLLVNQPTRVFYKGNLLFTPKMFLLVPCVDIGQEVATITLSDGTNTYSFNNDINFYTTMHNICQEPTLINIYKLSKLPFLSDLQVSYDTITQNLSITINATNESIVCRNVDYLDTETATTTTRFCGFALQEFTINDNKYTYYFEFTSNKDIYIPFDIKYIPYLLDENFITYKYGERGMQTEFPLHELNNVSITNIATYDILMTNRIYKIVDNTEEIDNYLTTKVCNSIEYLDTLSDAWKTYEAQNTGTLGLGIGLSFLKNIFSGFTTGAMAGPSLGLATGVGGAIQTLGKYAVNEINLKNTPDLIAQNGCYSTNFINKNLDVVEIIEQVEDIELCGRKIEYYGYLVNEYQEGNIITNNLNRQYYNVVKCLEINFNLTCLEVDKIKEDLTRRFTNGLRLWEIKDTLDYYITQYLQYDNVEL